MLVLVALRDAPPGTLRPTPPGLAELRRGLADTWREPGTRIGLYTHLVTQFSGTVFVLLWGYPFLVVGEGRSPGDGGRPAHPAGARRHGRGPGARPAVRALAAAPVGPRLRRSSGATAVDLDRRPAVARAAPRWPLLVVLVVVLGTNGPGSMIGFDYARTENPPQRMGSASGVVNVGGFVASLLTILAVGVVLDLLTPGPSTDYDLDAFRAAFAVQYVFWAIGLVGVLRHRKEMRARLARDGIVLAPLLRRGERAAARRFGLPLTGQAGRTSSATTTACAVYSSQS